MTVVMSRPSRACVHSAEIVYIALPSASSAMTGRCGQAMAAPAASGSPWPIAPPVSVSQSCGGAPAVAAGRNRPDVTASSETIAPSGSSAPMTAAAVCGVRSPRGSPGRAAAWAAGAVPSATRPASDVIPGPGQDMDLAPVGHQRAWLAGIGEERNRGTGAGKDQVAGPRELVGREFRQVGESVYRGEAGAALMPGRERLADQPRAGRRGDPAGRP